MERKLQRLLDIHGLLFAVAVDPSGAIVASAGDADAFAATELFSGLLGPYGSAKATFDGIEGPILPTIWQQGDDFAFCDKPAADVMVVLFGRGIKNVGERYQLSVKVGHSIATEFKKSHPGLSADSETSGTP